MGPFVATGPAVNDGIVCASGDVLDVSSKFAGFTDFGFNIQVQKEFTCDDDSGSFFMKLQVRIDHKGDNFNWVIAGGTGDYERLHGAGSGVGINPQPTTIDDIYDGKLH